MASTKQQNEKSGNEWFLRIGGESVFGPVSREGLLLWAEQGRVLPGHEVSQDRKAWMDASAVDFLEMRWFVDDGQGELRGPLNRKAAEALLASGKLPAGSQIVSSDEVENSTAESTPEGIRPLQDRIHELESQVDELRDMLKVSKQQLAVAQEASSENGEEATELLSLKKQLSLLAEEKDALQVQLVEKERSLSALRDAGSAASSTQIAAEAELKSLQEKFEKIQLENKNLQQSLEAAQSENVAAQEQVASLKKDISERDESYKAMKASLDAEKSHSAEIERTGAEQLAVLRQRLETFEAGHEELLLASKKLREEKEEAQKQVVELKNQLSEQAADTKSLQENLEHLQSALDVEQKKTADLTDKEIKLRETLKEKEDELTQLLITSNQRDQDLQQKIDNLQKLASLSPEEIERFYSCRDAIYGLVRMEVDSLEQAQDAERTYFDQLKQACQKRLAMMAEHRQLLLRHLGTNPEEMARRTLREQPYDSQNARLRAELENLKVTSQRELEQATTREQEMGQRMRILESESARMKDAMHESERLRFQMQDLQGLLTEKEEELKELRRKREEENKNSSEMQQALLNRIDNLENQINPAAEEDEKLPEPPPEEEPPARSVSSWLHFGK